MDGHATSDASLVRGHAYARVVGRTDVPVCPLEAELQRRGARVTRLCVEDLLPRRSLDGLTFRLLGKLYSGLIVPDDACRSCHDLSVAAGIPVVNESQDIGSLVA